MKQTFIFLAAFLFLSVGAHAQDMLQTGPHAGLIMVGKDAYELRGRVASHDQTTFIIDTPYKKWTVSYKDFDFNGERRAHLGEHPIVQVFGELDDVYTDKAKITKPEGMIMYLDNGMKYTFRDK